jgi:hypothetical protein
MKALRFWPASYPRFYPHKRAGDGLDGLLLPSAGAHSILCSLHCRHAKLGELGARAPVNGLANTLGHGGIASRTILGGPRELRAATHLSDFPASGHHNAPRLGLESRFLLSADRKSQKVPHYRHTP